MQPRGGCLNPIHGPVYSRRHLESLTQFQLEGRLGGIPFLLLLEGEAGAHFQVVRRGTGAHFSVARRVTGWGSFSSC